MSINDRWLHPSLNMIPLEVGGLNSFGQAIRPDYQQALLRMTGDFSAGAIPLRLSCARSHRGPMRGENTASTNRISTWLGKAAEHSTLTFSMRACFCRCTHDPYHQSSYTSKDDDPLPLGTTPYPLIETAARSKLT